MRLSWIVNLHKAIPGAEGSRHNAIVCDKDQPEFRVPREPRSKTPIRMSEMVQMQTTAVSLMI